MRVHAVSWLALAACHVTTQSEVTRPAKTERIRHPENAIGRRPTLVLADTGRLRFVEPLECPTEEMVTDQRAIEIERGPNLATFIVGVIATAAGGILMIRGASDIDGAANPFTYLGAASLAVGLPLTIGPWIGNTSEVRPGPPLDPVRRPGPAESCGERGFPATSATLATRGIEIFGRVERDGTFAISPFDLVDAFEATKLTAAWNITGRVEAPSGARTVDVVIEARALAAYAPTFLSRADFDAKIEPLRVVPNLVPGTLRASLTNTSDGPAARIVLAIKNDGPGPSHALRGHVSAPGTPALDGRILYFGHVAKGASVTRELLIPLSAAAADAIRNDTIELSLELRDAHATAPTTPVKFRGPILVDAPR